MLFDSAVKTIHAVFPQLDFYVAEGNVVTVGYDNPRSADELARVAAERDKAYDLRYKLADMLAHRRQSTSTAAMSIDPRAKILTDDFAPVEALKAIEAHNRKWPITQPPAGALTVLSFLDAFFVGSVLMGFEMLGSRYLFPYFGGGIGTWAGLISTVLCALTIGYFVGGAFVDRYRSRASSPPRS